MLNRLYFSTPNHYDDPFDTLIHVDFDAIENEINQGSAQLKIYIL